ncbi:MAG: hypothetical protein L6R38_001821 [Xanthoria sp. 2 TBL-2021]|nr:MAG: hypothetical protein L6R38_001821 [Xanthoria sp. 2 TBL-2021]
MVSRGTPALLWCPLSYPQTDVFLVRFSVTLPASFENVREKRFPEVHHNRPGVPCLVDGTQVDLQRQRMAPVRMEDGERMAKELGAVNIPTDELGFLPRKIDPEVLKHMIPSAVGFRAPNPRTTLRNQLDRMSIVNSDGTALAALKFLSEKNREASCEMEKERRISDAEAFTKPELADSTKVDVPVMYRLMEIKYSRYDFIHEIGYLYKLEILGIEGNPLDEELMEEIIRRGSRALVTHLRENTPGKRCCRLD